MCWEVRPKFVKAETKWRDIHFRFNRVVWQYDQVWLQSAKASLERKKQRNGSHDLGKKKRLKYDTLVVHTTKVRTRTTQMQYLSRSDD